MSWTKYATLLVWAVQAFFGTITLRGQPHFPFVFETRVYTQECRPADRVLFVSPSPEEIKAFSMKAFGSQDGGQSAAINLTLALSPSMSSRAHQRSKTCEETTQGEVFKGEPCPLCQGVLFVPCCSRSYFTPWNKACPLICTDYLAFIHPFRENWPHVPMQLPSMEPCDCTESRVCFSDPPRWFHPDTMTRHCSLGYKL